jgi:alkaline phosphatase D
MRDNIMANLRTSLSIAIAATLLHGCATTTANDGVQVQSAPASAQEALRPYYDSLKRTLPVAAPNPAIAPNEIITRFAFGSCLNENRSMAFWDVIAGQKPQAFLLIGDNVYGDTGSLSDAAVPTLAASYRKLSSRQEFDRFRRTVPMITTWDDHDMGANDAGGSFAFKEYTEQMYESFWNSSDEVRGRPGIYDSRIIGPVGKRVQFIVLDTRFFRSDTARMPYRDPAPALGWTIPNDDPNATILGDAQWTWLAKELEKPAELRFIISSIQVLTRAHNYESWYNFPREQARLFALLKSKNALNAILLSGDRHSGAIYKQADADPKKAIWEITSSSLNFAFGKGDDRAKEPDPLRTTGFWGIPNFGQIDINWANKNVTLSLRKDDGSLIEQQVVGAIQ